MSDITKKYVDYAGLQEYDSQIKGVISTDFVGATSSADGAAGRVPAPESGDENKFLRGDGTWAAPAAGSVTGVKGDAESTYRDGNVNITAANIGLGNVDNTSDANKPISTAVANEIHALQSVNSYNIIPCTSVKTTTIENFTITNNLDGTYTLNGTTTNYQIFVDLVSGVIQTDQYKGPHYMTPVIAPFQNDQPATIKFTVGNDNSSNVALEIHCWDANFTFNNIGHAAHGWQKIVTTDLSTWTFDVKYISFYLSIAPNKSFDNVIIAPACWNALTASADLGAGALSNAAIFDYVRRYTRTTFTGTSSEWEALNPNVKKIYQLVILTDD